MTKKENVVEYSSIKIRWSIFPTIFMFLIPGALICLCWGIVFSFGYMGMVIPAILVLIFPGSVFFSILFYPFPVIITSNGFSVFRFKFNWNEVSNIHVMSTTSFRGKRMRAVAFSYSDECKSRLNKIFFYKRMMWLVLTIVAQQSNDRNTISFPFNLGITPENMLHKIQQMQTIGNAG
jgi:hypothetical protein